MIRVAVCQTVGKSTLKESLENMENIIEKAATERPNLDLIVFPEYVYGSAQIIGALPSTREHTERIAAMAKKYHVNILGGSFPRDAGNGKIFNTVYFYNRDGKIIGKYDKTHLAVSRGYDETKIFEAGDHLEVIDTDFGRVGIMVCFELRFPEVTRSLANQGAQIILCPAEWPCGAPLPPRTDHWDILVRSAALTNLCWVVACNDFGDTPDGEIPFGRSMVVDLWGIIKAQCGGHEDIIFADINLDDINDARSRLSVWPNRRPKLYTLD